MALFKGSKCVPVVGDEEGEDGVRLSGSGAPHPLSAVNFSHRVTDIRITPLIQC